MHDAQTLRRLKFVKLSLNTEKTNFVFHFISFIVLQIEKKTMHIKLVSKSQGELAFCVSLDFLLLVIHSFFIGTFFYKNVEAEIYPNFKNMLRTYPRLRVRKRLYFAHLR